MHLKADYATDNDAYLYQKSQQRKKPSIKGVRKKSQKFSPSSLSENVRIVSTPFVKFIAKSWSPHLKNPHSLCPQ